MRWGILVVLLVLGSCAGVCAAAEPTPYYTRVMFSYRIKPDGSVSLTQEYTLFNPFPRAMIYAVTHYIPTSETKGISVRGDGVDYTVTRSENCTGVEVRFTVGGRTEFTYRITCTARGLVSGSGPGYVARLGGVSLGEGGYPYENLVVEITGPEGTRLLSSLPQADMVSPEPPTIRYETRVEAPGKFDGVMVSFYIPKVFYRVTITNELSNAGSESATGVRLDLTLFPELEWQFSALAGPSTPIAMYADAENNFHAVFEVGELAPGSSTSLSLDVIYEVSLYDPGVTEDNCGTVGEVDPSMGDYLKPDEMWEVTDPLIASKARELSGGEVNSWSIASRIAGFVASSLEYEVQEARRGALWALVNLRGDCSEFTDLFISLARAAGIPAKAVYGWGYSGDNLTGHAWAMAYLPGAGWLPVDPTWAQRTGDHFARMDTAHIARCARGAESSETVMMMAYRGEAPSVRESVRAELIGTQDAAVYLTRAAAIAVEVAGRLMERHGREDLSGTYATALNELNAARSSAPAAAVNHAKISLQSSYEIIRALGNVEEGGLPWLWIAIAAGAAALAAAACALARMRR